MMLFAMAHPVCFTVLAVMAMTMAALVLLKLLD
jgi:hypothetical protein